MIALMRVPVYFSYDIVRFCKILCLDCENKMKSFVTNYNNVVIKMKTFVNYRLNNKYVYLYMSL